MDCNRIISHISSINCNALKVKEIDEIVSEQINNITVYGSLDEETSKIVCYETYVIEGN